MGLTFPGKLFVLFFGLGAVVMRVPS